MRNISSNTLFHFTNNPENLISILNEGFYPRYCLEEINRNSFTGIEPKEQAYAMTCFCDLPLSQIYNHLEFYGSYGIGLSKKWGFKLGLNPISYVNYESTKLEVIK